MTNYCRNYASLSIVLPPKVDKDAGIIEGVQIQNFFAWLLKVPVMKTWCNFYGNLMIAYATLSTHTTCNDLCIEVHGRVTYRKKDQKKSSAKN